MTPVHFIPTDMQDDELQRRNMLSNTASRKHSSGDYYSALPTCYGVN